jgi:major membrane immunogen (membrane-anchored lipoprotein)
MMIRKLTVTFINFLLLLGLVCTNAVALGESEPSGSRALAPKIPERQRYLAIVVFNYESDPAKDDEIIENAARMGCNAAEISVHWDKVLPTRNSAPNWKVVDSHVNTALRMGMKVAIRIQVAREPPYLTGFWNDEQSMMAGDNSLMYFGRAVQFSFAHQATLELAKDFVRLVTQHFQYLQQQDQLLFMSATASPIQEGEYSPRNGRGDISYPIPFDYSDPMKQGFRQWLQGRFTLDVLNRRWGSDFSKWEAVVPPPYNQSDPYISFSRGRWGEDWYVFRHLMLKRFLDETTRTIKEVNGSIQVVNQHGCVWDRQSGLRGTFAFKNLAQNADGVKINDGPDYNHRFSMDVVRSNIKPGAWVCNEVDGLFHSSVTVDRFYDQVAESFEQGARLVTLANFAGWDARPALNQLIQQVVARGLLSQPVTQVQTASSTTYKLSSMVKDDAADPEGRAGDQWSRQYFQNGKKPVNISINEDWLEDNANQDPRVSKLIPNQTAYVEKPFEFSIPSGTFEDPDGSITKVEISSGLPAQGLSANGVTISGTPNATGTITVTVRAFDNKNSPVTTQFQITVQGPNANQSPVVSQTIQDRSAVLGQDYSFRIPDETFKDPDGRIVSINASDLPAGLSYNSDTYTISGKPANEGVSTITLKATDDKGTSVSTSFKLTVTKQDEVNKPPVVSKTIPSQTATVGQNFSYIIATETFSDPDGQITGLEVSGLTNGLNYDADSRTIKGSPVTAGTITVKVKASDNKGASVTTEFRLTINSASSPEQLSILEPAVDCNTGEIKFRTSGGDGTKIEFKAVGISDDWTPNTTFTIPAWLRNGITFDIVARQSGKEIKYSYTTSCKGYEPPVVAKAMSDQSFPIGQFFILRIPVETFQASTPLVVGVSALPEGLAFDKVTRAISGTPTKAGTTSITITATDDRSAKVEDVFLMTIRETAALTILAPTLNCQTAKLTIRTDGGNGSAVTYSIPGIRDWGSDPTFTIPADKLYGTELKLLARQSDREISYTYTTTCSAPGSSTLADQTIYVGESYTYSLPDPGAGISYKVSGLPDGLTYNAGNRAISGSPTQIGTTKLVIKATDDKGTEIGSLSFNLIVIGKPTTPGGNGNYEGYLDLVSCLNVAGWVWDAGQPNTPLTVEFLVGSTLESARLVGTTVANLFRQDLRDNSKGNGSHGYRWDTADELKNNQTYSIWGRVQGTTYLLKGSPKTLTCSGNSNPTPTNPTTNQPPVGPSLSSLSATATVAYLTTLPVFTDPENGALTYTLSGTPAGLSFDPVTRGLSGVATTAGSYKLTYTATDNQGAKTSIDVTLTINPAPGSTTPTTPATVVSGSFEGFLDVVNCQTISGWVWDANRPNTPLTIEFLVGSTVESARLVGSIEASLFRQDVKDNGKGNGSHGYRWDTPEGLKNNQTYSIWARIQGTTYLLKGSPKTLTCTGATIPTTPATNQPPVGPALSSLSTTVNVAYLTVLPVFTDPENGALTYELSGVPAGLSFDRVTRGLSGLATTAGSYKLTYTATDNQGAKTSIDITLTVNPAPGSTTPTTPTTVVSGSFEGYLDLVSCQAISGWVWDANQPNTPSTIEFLVGSTLESARLVGTTVASMFRQDLKDNGKGNGNHGYSWNTPDELRNNQTYSIWARIQGTTYLLKGSPKTLTCTGNTTPTTPATNQPPVGPALSNLTATATVAYLTVLPVFTDPENGALTYELSGVPTGLSFDRVTRGLSGAATTAGSYKLTYTATDNQGAKTSIDITLTVNPAPGSTTPTTPATVVSGSFEGYLDLVSCQAISGWVWDANQPNTPSTIEFLVGSTLESARLVGTTVASMFRQDLKDNGKGNGNHGYSWNTPDELRNNQTYSIWARIQGTTYLLKGSPKTLTCGSTTPTTPTNQPPVAPTLSTLTATVGVAYLTVLPVFTDPESGPLTYAVSGLPVGLAFDPVTRGISGLATTAGSYKLTYTATDNQSAKTSVDVTLTVNPAPTTPTNPNASALVVLAPDYDCQTGRITFRTSGGDNTLIEYRAIGVTDWTTSSTQTVFLTMRKGSTFDIEARQSQKVVKYTFTTTCSDGRSPINDQVITKGLFYTFTLPEAGAGIQLDVTGLPEGITYNASNRTSSGKPINAGDYTVTVKSTGADQKTNTITFKLTVREPQLTVQLMKAGNAASRQIIQELTNNNAIGISNLPDKINFFCTSNVPVGSISFELTGTSQNNYVDNQAPFGLFGDDDGFKPQTGGYVLRLAAFTGANGSGETIITKNIAFSFVPGGGRTAVQNVTDNAETVGETWQVYPNPIREVINLTLPHSVSDQTETAMPYRFSLSSATGTQWELRDNTVNTSQRKAVLDVKTLQLPTGLYFLQIHNEKGVLKVIKVLKQ